MPSLVDDIDYKLENVLAASLKSDQIDTVFRSSCIGKVLEYLGREGLLMVE